MRKNQVDSARLILGSYVTELVLETQFSDMDVMRHLNNVSIARFYESARARFFMALFGGEVWPVNLPDNIGIGMVEANISYFSEGFYPAPVTVGTSIASIGRRSYTVQQGLFQNGQCIGLCESAFVFMRDHQACEIPAETKEKLTGALSSSRPECKL